MPKHLELLFRLLGATSVKNVAETLQRIGDHSESSVDTPFGESGYLWRFYGNTDSNLSTIHLGSKPGRSLTERITNAIDAVLEDRMAAGGPVPSSPMEAAKVWFGRPPTTADNGLFKWKNYRDGEYDQLVQVVIHPGDDPSAPTVDILDAGIGLHPSEFAATIVSLQRGNKMKKPYLVGAYGQGGSATIRYCKYTLIVSRHMSNPAIAGFTLVRRMRLPDPYKVDAYVYLCVREPNGEVSVPSCELAPGIDFYESFPNHGVKSWDRGTLVRHYGYELKGLENPLQASPGNLYHEFQALMFDPLLPFRLIDLRAPKSAGKYRNEVIRGSRNRLMNYTLKDVKEDNDPGESDEGSAVTGSSSPKSVLRHHVPRQLVSLRSDSTPCVGIEYWVMLSERKTGDKITLRQSSELFVDRGHPIIGTLHGQNQGDRTDVLFRDLDIPTVSKHIVVHIDASAADRDTRLGLFVSTREGFSEGNEFKELIRLLTEILRDDEELYVIENELIERIISKETAATDSEVKKEIASLLRDAGLQLTQPGDTSTGTDGNKDVQPKPKPHVPRPQLPPLLTLPYPDATRLEIRYPEDEFRVPLNERHAVGVETDADPRFDHEGRLAIRAEPPLLEVASKGELHGGRIRWRLRPTESSKAGDTGEIIVSLTKPNGNQLTDSVPFEILPIRLAKGKDSKGLLPDFDIRSIDPYKETDLADQLWPDASQDDFPHLAYKTFPMGQKIIVYYSTAFSPYRSQFQQLAARPALAQLFEHEYKIWIGYHAILQHMSRHEPTLNPDPAAEERTILERYMSQIQDQAQDKERSLVGEMQVKQALKSAELKSKSLKGTAN
jgi:hypothetical protein